ncbi:hypothetical protein Barba22A_gp055 [Rheinheimera phage vB_RspM_Barba22A]|jgi:hypothetical protein|uniref:Uncharacterized protein n=82 Tax=Barbavirus TaxID=2733095 RepID=A0A7G9VRT5_9CAUD|nr:hypothetical protein HOV44_gp059 [Rheinheimera phage Barba5S]YP_009822932.1 hypothetical protein HOV46_gp055 [Rheinheimera phage vB_RspM_Barba18A]YP_009823211.1 hypothetical protein HOV48_gp055 [Rheinheimera phage Barba21A]QCQ57906.1 hypothetical protein Barba1A_gp055 [Rheinheimera phage vB_RspM_Barba1A]QCQ58042.1 hypothetical protein Barba1S_gp055 [Rheinheimera phage vB_RspM_Barba1S]QCQ58178.1 hypothetical protein Barba2A_gp055 [Rheinheimera phage vB_RspM_Barba2A]QCQ58314.1 hypothetical p
MSLKTTWLPEFRYVPRKIKTGWFTSQIVQVLQQKYRVTGEYYSPDVSGQYNSIPVDKTGWDYVHSHPATLVNLRPAEYCEQDN